ncbi:MAG: histidine--tRNA ligase [Chitinophagales bacterium]|nr:histidine--tRNA ligase [Chitinophagales bacterium]
MIKPRVFKGARDFLPEQMLHREQILSVMRTVFKQFGFAPIETPAIEYLNVLSGKYGEDADRLIYKLNYKTDTKDEAALHYDLTVPFSRVIAMHPHLTMPFKRYQIQPVWRADRPQPHQGRFREFYQCDVDCVGSTSMIIDAELIAITYQVLTILGFDDFLIKINNRKILNGLTTYLNLTTEFTPIIARSIDKLDKTHWNDVAKELADNQVPNEAIAQLEKLVQEKVTLQTLSELLQDVEIAQEGIAELNEIFNYLKILNVNENNFIFDISLARGLDYYTGPIFETKLPKHPHIGSLTGGGRYDTLISMFTGNDVPAVGTTLGLDRIFTAMQQLNLLADINTATQVLVANFSKETLTHTLALVTQLRAAGINTELYPETDKLKKQFSYCDKKKIPFMCVLGEDEIKNNTVVLKNMKQGTQEQLAFDDLLLQLKNL